MAKQLTFTFEDGATPEVISAQLRFEANLILGLPPKEACKKESVAEEKGTEISEKKKSSKKEKVEEETTDELEEDGTFDLGEDEKAEEEEETDEKISQEEIVAGFQKYAKKKGRDKAGVLLKKYKVKSVYDLDEKHYEKVIKELAA